MKNKSAKSSKRFIVPVILGSVVILAVDLIGWICFPSRSSEHTASTNPAVNSPGETNGKQTSSGEPRHSDAAPAINADYREARKHFRTTLTVRSGSPQRGEQIIAPPGAELIDYTSGELSLKAIFAVPEREGKRPAVVFLHGGFAFGEGDWEMSQPFIEAGFAVMTPILRGENGQPGDFSLYSNEVDDVLAAVNVLKQHPRINPDCLFVTCTLGEDFIAVGN